MLLKENDFGQNFIWLEPCAGADTPEKRQEAIDQTNAVIKKIYGEHCGYFEYSEKTQSLTFGTRGGFWQCEDGGHYFSISHLK